jgi:phosphoribosylanthranilate isomerase
MTKAKICGLSTPDAVTAALDGGAVFLGFVFFAKSPRHLEPETAARLAAPARGRGAQTVALVVDPDDEALDRIVRILDPDLIQLHGAETPVRTREISQRTGKPIIKALPIATSADLAQAAAYDGLVEHLMFDAKPPKDADRPGGLGAAFDWSILTGARFQKPYFLAGGLDPWNVSEAVRQSGASLVDVSSGVERGPGLKDPALITAFLEAVSRV